MKIVSNLIGIFVVLGLAFLISNNKKNIPWKLVLKVMGVQAFYCGIFSESTVWQKNRICGVRRSIGCH